MIVLSGTSAAQAGGGILQRGSGQAAFWPVPSLPTAPLGFTYWNG
jgi:hypothetical protein